MMKIVSLCTQKGGASKSTTAANIAVAAHQAGRKVFLLELDRQGTLSDWADNRKPEGGPDVEHIDSNDLDRALGALKTGGYQLVVIDTPGVDSPAVAHAMRVSDLCLIPCRPTAPDLRGALPTVQALLRLDRPFAFVLSHCPPRGPRIDEARAGLSALGIVAEPPIAARADHQDAIAAGLGVTEFAPSGAAADEIRRLWAWVDKKLEKNK